ncbi:HDIG domain-containing protein [Desulforhopalus vacuolatus]|uniref:HDIG domain-containing metalloprotein n=1 Tax=Desulforhopalus vacuolatus TaxID=40414 RepID=UPI0019624B14|nr:HDIG domain-containing metalloprotein [Desulforhopalus vacuolatus]MBM9518560.1 HDIG domain-containing protein [Desulforhopalus vacuolatus]
MKLPELKECFQCFDQYSMLDNIREHSIMVTRVAETLYDNLSSALPPENLPEKRVVIIGALMHDIAKSLCLNDNRPHAVVGMEICQQHGWPELAKIVEEHVLLKHFDDEAYQRGVFGAKELVFYSDKRVNHHEVVTLNQRLAYILERYSRDDPYRIKRIRANFETGFTLEKRFFSHIDFPPEELSSHLQPSTDDFGLTAQDIP